MFTEEGGWRERKERGRRSGRVKDSPYVALRISPPSLMNSSSYPPVMYSVYILMGNGMTTPILMGNGMTAPMNVLCISAESV